ncbi:hypothetical protein EDB85DRAFT_1985179 [Lactarius pseudohatsudake]|nr:hypothetical protein EDB85DRAFT_1985179 [Lactarius pseudohatsudake]
MSHSLVPNLNNLLIILTIIAIHILTPQLPLFSLCSSSPRTSVPPAAAVSSWLLPPVFPLVYVIAMTPVTLPTALPPGPPSHRASRLLPTLVLVLLVMWPSSRFTQLRLIRVAGRAT